MVQKIFKCKKCGAVIKVSAPNTKWRLIFDIKCPSCGQKTKVTFDKPTKQEIEEEKINDKQKVRAFLLKAFNVKTKEVTK